MSTRKTNFPDNTYREIPETYFIPCEKGGTLEVIEYNTKDYHGCGEAFHKAAYVYLPYGYTDTKKYDVFYLMHGGGGNELDYFGGAVKGAVTKELLDNMIAQDEISPCIVVAPSYNNPFNPNATENCKYFASELVNDLIPAIELRYSTYLNENSLDAIRSTRLHRAFGGFSMGSACTWWVFEFALREVGYFMPISGDSWCKTGFKLGEGTAEYMRDIVLGYGYTKDDFIIYSGTGTKDIAYPNMTPLIEEMKKLDDVFVYCDNFENGNLYYALREDGYHNIETIYRIIYNGLPKFFG